MTDLTEQWKKGKFVICNAGKCQYYYVKNEKQQEVIKTEYCLFDDNTPNWQVLAPVPSYEEWEQLQNWADFTDDYHALREQKEIAEYEIAQLKETNEALKSELKEVCDVLIRKCPEMREWVMLNWKNLYEV